MAELLRVQSIIVAAKPEQLGMRALLRDLSIFDDDNPVRTPNGGEAMRNDK